MSPESVQRFRDKDMRKIKTYSASLRSRNLHRAILRPPVVVIRTQYRQNACQNAHIGVTTARPQLVSTLVDRL